MQHTTKKYQITTGGFTLIELLVVMGLIVVVGAATTPFLSSFLSRNNLSTTTNKVIGTIRKAQQYAIDGKNDFTWGVCSTSTTIRLFGGTSGSTCESNSVIEEYTIPSSISLTGLTTTTFTKRRGEPSNTLAITVSSAIDSTSIVVNSAGGMTIN